VEASLAAHRLDDAIGVGEAPRLEEEGRCTAARGGGPVPSELGRHPCSRWRGGGGWLAEEGRRRGGGGRLAEQGSGGGAVDGSLA
jgi:hypothetical protein